MRTPSQYVVCCIAAFAPADLKMQGSAIKHSPQISDHIWTILYLDAHELVVSANETDLLLTVVATAAVAVFLSLSAAALLRLPSFL